LPAIQAENRDSGASIVVLDDDPTGTQTVYDVPILTDWATGTLACEFLAKTPLFYVLTNSRSLTEAAARNLTTEIGMNLKTAAQQTGRSFVVISRSDSTLRGHFPAEVDALAEVFGQTKATRVLIPFFLEGGRYTIGDTHYVKEGPYIVPAHETPFAQDAVFGYSCSNMPKWVAQKTHGQVSPDAVVTLSLEDIRTGGPSRIEDKLRTCRENDVCVVNAATYRDLEVATLGLIRAEKQGARFLYRTAASFVRVRAGLSAHPLLSAKDLALPKRSGALLVVGSYVPRTSEQISYLTRYAKIRSIEVQVTHLLSERTKAEEIRQAAGLVNETLGNDSDVMIYTSRDLVAGQDAEENLAMGSQISNGLVDLVREISVRPRYLLAKGGVTSSDLATKALGIKRAIVLGQILPGVPVWKMGRETCFPDMPYIVFPGNVGGRDALAQIVDKLAPC
jgi:uncharacterized protein YgbK (DUF1537 family)